METPGLEHSCCSLGLSTVSYSIYMCGPWCDVRCFTLSSEGGRKGGCFRQTSWQSHIKLLSTEDDRSVSCLDVFALFVFCNFIVAAKEVTFSPVSICWFACRITQKLLSGLCTEQTPFTSVAAMIISYATIGCCTGRVKCFNHTLRQPWSIGWSVWFV